MLEYLEKTAPDLVIPYLVRSCLLGTKPQFHRMEHVCVNVSTDVDNNSNHFA